MYKAAVLSALSLRQIFTPAQLVTLTKLCNAFHRRRPPKPSILTWVIGLVLCVITLAPFEPLDSASLEAIMYTTFVLIALALGTCRGKLRALHRDRFVRLAEDWSFVLLYSDPSFIPKTAKGRPPTELYKLRALPPGAPPRVDAAVLCSVRALEAYLGKTADPSFVNNRETLFLPLNRTSSLTRYCISKLFAELFE